MTLHHACQVKILVPWENEKAPRIRPDRLILAPRHLDCRGTVLVGALTNEPNQLRIVGSEFREAIVVEL